MSYTSLYGIKSDFTAVELKQYKNSWIVSATDLQNPWRKIFK